MATRSHSEAADRDAREYERDRRRALAGGSYPAWRQSISGVTDEGHFRKEVRTR